jgi:hypothetical protein
VKGHTYSKRRQFPYAFAKGVWQERGAIADAVQSNTGGFLPQSRAMKRVVKSWVRGLPPIWRPGYRRAELMCALAVRS